MLSPYCTRPSPLLSKSQKESSMKASLVITSSLPPEHHLYLLFNKNWWMSFVVKIPEQYRSIHIRLYAVKMNVDRDFLYHYFFFLWGGGGEVTSDSVSSIVRVLSTLDYCVKKCLVQKENIVYRFFCTLTPYSIRYYRLGWMPEKKKKKKKKPSAVNLQWGLWRYHIASCIGENSYILYFDFV